jgi:hypothetical protein
MELLTVGLVILIVLGLIYLTGFFGNNKNPDPRKWKMNPINWFIGWKCDSNKCTKIHTVKPKYTTEADCKEVCATYYQCDDSGDCVEGGTNNKNDPTCGGDCGPPKKRTIYYNEIISIKGLESALSPDIVKHGGSNNDVRYILLPNVTSIGIGTNHVGNEQIVNSDSSYSRKPIETNASMMIGTIGSYNSGSDDTGLRPINNDHTFGDPIVNTTSLGGYDTTKYDTTFFNPYSVERVQWLSYGTGSPKTYKFLKDDISFGMCVGVASCTVTFKLKSSSNDDNHYNLIPLDKNGKEIKTATPLTITLGCQEDQTMYDLNLDGETIKKPGCWFKPNKLNNYNWKLSACQTSSGHCPKGMKLIEPSPYNSGQWEITKMNMNMTHNNDIVNSTIDGKTCPHLYEFTTRIDSNEGPQTTSVPGAGCVPDSS